MIDFGRGYGAAWRLFRVNPDTWADTDELGGVRSMTVENMTTDLLQKATMTVDVDPAEEFSEGYYRVVMYATQGVATERVDVATVYCTTTGGSVEYGSDALGIGGSSVLYPASRNRLVTGEYAPKGSDGARLAGRLLRSCCKAPVTVQGSFTLDDHVVFSAGSTALEAARLVLDAGGYCIMLSGRGEVTVCPMPTEPSLELDATNARLLQPKVDHRLDLSSVRNRYIAKSGGEVAVAVNDDPNSPTSTVSRGYPDDEYDTSPKLVNGETLQQYAERRLHELSVVEDTRTYKREWWPDVTPNSVVRGSMASVKLVGDLRVSRQRLTLGTGIVVEETAALEVSTWR